MLISPLSSPLKKPHRMPMKAAANIERAFHRLKPTASQHYRLGSYDFGSEYELEIPWATTSTRNQVLLGDSHVDTYYLNISNGIAWWSEGVAHVFDSGGVDIQDGRLHTLAIISTQSQLRMLLNGIELTRITSAAWSPYHGTVENILIGSSNSNPVMFDGVIPGLKIWTNGDRTTGTLTEFQFDTDLASPYISSVPPGHTVTAINMTSDDAQRYQWDINSNAWIGPDLLINGDFQTEQGWVVGDQFHYDPVDQSYYCDNAQGASGTSRALYRVQERPQKYRISADLELSQGRIEFYDGADYNHAIEVGGPTTFDVTNQSTPYWYFTLRTDRGTTARFHQFQMQEILESAT